MSLPPELVLVIAQYLSDTGCLSDLAAFTRLLKLEWRYTRALQRVLFSSVHLDTYERYDKLMRTLRLRAPPRGYRFASMVHNVSATLNAEPAPGHRPLLAENLLSLYDQCPRLTKITLAGIRSRRPREPIVSARIDLYPFEQLVTIQSLTIVCSFEPLGLLLLQHLPNLTELRIFGGYIRFQLGDRPPRSGSNLRSLTWGAHTPPDALSIKWLLAYSADSTGGEIILVTPPYMDLQLEQIRDYALQRRMNFRSPPASSIVQGTT